MFYILLNDFTNIFVFLFSLCLCMNLRIWKILIWSTFKAFVFRINGFECTYILLLQIIRNACFCLMKILVNFPFDVLVHAVTVTYVTMNEWKIYAFQAFLIQIERSSIKYTNIFRNFVFYKFCMSIPIYIVVQDNSKKFYGVDSFQCSII